MSRSSRNALAWTCIALLATFVAQSNAALVLCVGEDHAAIEPVHAGRDCAPEADSLGSPESHCTDTLLLQSSTAAPSERATVAALPLVATLGQVARARTPARTRSAGPPPPRELDRARSSTVLLI